MKNSKTHTPLPWSFDSTGPARPVIRSVANPDKPQTVLIVDSWVNLDDVALIVRAVNSHQTLVDALHNGLRAMKALGWEQAAPSLNRTAYEQARQALALATN